MREVALRTLANRFGSVPAEIEQALEASGKERLLDVATHAGTDTLEQVRAPEFARAPGISDIFLLVLIRSSFCLLLSSHPTVHRA